MTRRRLAALLAALFLALAIPTAVLVYQAYGQLKWEAFHQHQRLARELSLRIDAGFRELIEREEKRPIADYEFLSIAGADGTGFLQRSPLSNFPLETGLPGLLGYFQVDATGRLRTPLLPDDNAASYGIAARELAQREQQAGRIRGILGQNRLVGKSDDEASPEPSQAAAEETFRSDAPRLFSESDSVASSVARDDDEASAQSAFDQLSAKLRQAPAASEAPTRQLEDLKLEDRYEVAESVAPESRQSLLKKSQAEDKRARKEMINLPKTETEVAGNLQEKSTFADAVAGAPAEMMPEQQLVPIETFESEVEPLEFAQLDSGHFVLFRRVWQQNERRVQGILLERDGFIDSLVEPAFRQSTLSSMSRLIVAYRGGILREFAADYSRQYRPGASQTSNELLYQSRLIAPFGDIEIIFTLARLPIGAGGKVILWSALVLALVLIGGFLLLYRLGLRQLALARQQQDFVSAVSHELKTPLTSIRMYGEMLREGWADEARRKTYYDFIFHEAERLTRLINNVLQLARLSRNEQQPELAATAVADALDELRPRLQSQLDASGFELSMHGDSAVEGEHIRIDRDWFIQILINLVDNAIKFSADAETRRIDLGYRPLQDGRVEFSVRDYGPGIAPDQMKKIFKLFYRSENELTRETVGTGIGLALVRQLASAMDAEIDVVNCEPGAEFRIRFKRIAAGD